MASSSQTVTQTRLVWTNNPSGLESTALIENGVIKELTIPNENGIPVIIPIEISYDLFQHLKNVVNEVAALLTPTTTTTTTTGQTPSTTTTTTTFN